MGDDIIKQTPRNLPTLFRILNKYEIPNFLNEYLGRELPNYPENIILIISSYLGISEGGNRKIPHRSDLKFDQYKYIVEQIDEKLIMDVIEKNFETENLWSEDYPEQDDHLEDEDFVFVKQFYWFYKNKQKDVLEKV